MMHEKDVHLVCPAELPAHDAFRILFRPRRIVYRGCIEPSDESDFGRHPRLSSFGGADDLWIDRVRIYERK